MDPDMVVRELDLSIQGTPKSYGNKSELGLNSVFAEPSSRSHSSMARNTVLSSNMPPTLRPLLHEHHKSCPSLVIVSSKPHNTRMCALTLTFVSHYS